MSTATSEKQEVLQQALAWLRKARAVIQTQGQCGWSGTAAVSFGPEWVQGRDSALVVLADRVDGQAPWLALYEKMLRAIDIQPGQYAQVWLDSDSVAELDQATWWQYQCVLGTKAVLILSAQGRTSGAVVAKAAIQGGLQVSLIPHPVDFEKSPELKRTAWEELKRLKAFLAGTTE